VIDQLIAADLHLKAIYRVLVNESNGLQAARTSLAVARSKADCSRFHRALDAAGDPTSKSIANALAASGIDPRSLPPHGDEAMIDSSITAELMNNDALINQRKGTAVPAWVLGNASHSTDSTSRHCKELSPRHERRGSVSFEQIWPWPVRRPAGFKLCRASSKGYMLHGSDDRVRRRLRWPSHPKDQPCAFVRATT
jgi:hypothetical protein